MRSGENCSGDLPCYTISAVCSVWFELENPSALQCHSGRASQRSKAMMSTFFSRWFAAALLQHLMQTFFIVNFHEKSTLHENLRKTKKKFSLTSSQQPTAFISYFQCCEHSSSALINEISWERCFFLCFATSDLNAAFVYLMKISNFAFDPLSHHAPLTRHESKTTTTEVRNLMIGGR